MPVKRTLRYVNPHRRRGLSYQLNARLASSAFALWFSQRRIWGAVIWRIDPILLRLTGGRLSTGLLLPTALLQTRGARTGEPRGNAVIYFHDGERVTIFASKAGRPGNPAWFYNVRANPDVVFGGQRFRVEMVSDQAERDRLWALADRVFPAFAAYRVNAAAAGRRIPVIQLLPRSDES